MSTAAGTPQAAKKEEKEPSAPTGMILGIDVSSYQGKIDWAKVHAAGYAFVICKATEGKTHVDASYHRNVDGAREAGLLAGAYHFARPDNNGPLEEVDRYLASVGTDFSSLLPPVLDLEVKTTLSPDHVQSWAFTWMSEVQRRTDRIPVLYTFVSYIRKYFGTEDNMLQYYPLWISDPNDVTEPRISPWHDWRFWQYSTTGHVPGIESHVDLNRYSGTGESLRNLLKPYYI